MRGHVLAEDVYAPQDVPESRTTNVDGYAVRAGDPPGTYHVLSAQSWRNRNEPIPPGHIYRINTGAPLPAGCDAVVMVEDTELVSSTQDQGGRRTEEKEVKTLVQVAPYENVRLPGSDARKGDLVRILAACSRCCLTLAIRCLSVGRSLPRLVAKSALWHLSGRKRLVHSFAAYEIAECCRRLSCNASLWSRC